MTALRQREPRICNARYLKDVSLLPCLICLYDIGCDPAHIRYTAGPHKQNAGGGAKPHDYYAVPLCRYHHDEQHHYPLGERQWWKDQGLDPLRIAAQLYEHRGCPEAMLGLIHELHRKHPDMSEVPF